MSDKTYISDDEYGFSDGASQIGLTLDSLYSTIEQRRAAGSESYTHRLLTGDLDTLLKKISEESLEACLAAKESQLLEVYEAEDSIVDASIDHLRYEAADVVYHLLVLLSRMDIDIDEFAAELNMRMTEEERPKGAVRLKEEHIKRGK